MSGVSEKHIYAARSTLAGIVILFGSFDGYDRCVDAIAKALANAEREGMRRERERAAEILRGVGRVFDGEDGPVSSRCRDLLNTLADAILAEAEGA